MSSYVTPRQVAQALAVGESTVKRWCDRGLIAMVRTAGGHRKLAVADVLRFAREHDHKVVSPELLGLPAVGQGVETGLARSVPLLVDALLRGDESVARRLVFNLYMAKHPLSVVCDSVLAAAFREIGERWACDQADIYQERRGCETALRILFDLRRLQSLPDSEWTALGGTLPGDRYSLPTAMAELVLREVGFRATSLGTSLPVDSLVRAVEQNRPQLFWLSVSHIDPDLDFVNEFARLSEACVASGTALVVGGRALTEDLRQQITYSAYGDNMQHLEAFARTLFHRNRAATEQATR